MREGALHITVETKMTLGICPRLRTTLQCSLKARPLRSPFKSTKPFSTSTDFVPVVIVGGGPVGLFLSSLLSHYQIRSVLLESQSVEQRFRHPAAHFLNTRTMEVLASCLPRHVSSEIRQAMPPVSEWQSFTWGRHLCDPHPIATVVHPVHRPLQVGTDTNGVLVRSSVSETVQEFPTTTPLSPCAVGHLAQHTFGKILYNHASSLPSSTLLYDTQVSGVQILETDGGNHHQSATSHRPTVDIRTDKGHVYRANLCVAADGANSFVRQQLQIPWQPTTQPPLQQELYNIHVRLNARQIRHLQQYPASMLYTTLNPTAVAMVVRHSAAEYNIQLPTFPPYQRLHDLPQLLHSIFGFAVEESQVKSLSMWTMASRVAQRYVHGPVALVGDAAHVFPPAGGFGLNTGLQDAHNLAWKVAAATARDENTTSSRRLAAALTSYDRERRPIALQNAALSIRNYHRLLEVTKQLYLDESHPQLLRQSLDASSFLPLSVRQTMFDSLYQAALKPLGWLSDLQSTYRQHIQSRIRRALEKGTGLPLVFPRHEVLFDYSAKPCDDMTSSTEQQSFWQDTQCRGDVGLKVGRRLPFVPNEEWLTQSRPTDPTFILLFRDMVDDNLASWLSTQLRMAVQSGTSQVVPDADTIVLVRPDDMVAAILTRCSETPDFETLLVQAALDSFQQQNSHTRAKHPSYETD